MTPTIKTEENYKTDMLDFKRIELSDREWIEPLLMESGFQGSEYTFSNNYIYRKIYQIDVARMDGYYLVRSNKDLRYRSYLYPAGSGDVKPVIEAMMEDAREQGDVFRMHGVAKASAAQLEALFPDRFVIEEVRDNFDYIYESQRLITLAGKKLHSKRNFINRFKQENEGNWAYEPITPANLDECWDMNTRWCEKYGCDDTESLAEEACAVRNCFNNFEALGLSGGFLRVGDEIVAFTMGRPINHNTFIVHIEKAFSDVAGAYPMINQQFVSHAAADYQYINREDDVGDEGLRKAKLSYKPDILLEKYAVTLK